MNCNLRVLCMWSKSSGIIGQLNYDTIAILELYEVFVTSPKLCLGERLFYSCESVILFVVLWFCLWFCDQDNSKSSWPILMKFGTMLSYNKNKVWFQFDKNGFGRTLSNRNFKISITQKVMGEFLLTFTEWCVKSIII